MKGPEIPEVPARLVFANGEWSEAWARVIERTPAWRCSSALMQLGIWLMAPVVFWIPPHIPWVLTVLVAGAVRALNRFREHRTLLSLEGACPRCNNEQVFREVRRMRQPHTVHCAACHWELRVDVPLSGAAT